MCLYYSLSAIHIQYETYKLTVTSVIYICVFELSVLLYYLFYYVGTVNGPTSITRLGVWKMYQKVASFSILDTPPPKTDTNNFLGGGVRNFFRPPPYEKLLVDISYNIPVPVNRNIN